MRTGLSNQHEGAAGMEDRNADGTGKAVGMEMKKSVGGLQLVHVSRNVRQTELREGTTGRAIAIPRIMAVAETKPKPVAAPAVGAKVRGQLAFYRKYTEAMLSRYMRISMQPGRTPSLLGRELFRGSATHSTLNTFEDGIVFCVDVERCLAKLSRAEQQVIQRIALQGHTTEEAAPLLGLSFRSCYRRYSEALDHLTAILLEKRMFNPSESCQDVEVVEN